MITTRSLLDHCQITNRSLNDHYQITPALLPNHYQITTKSQPNHNQITTRSLNDHYQITTRSPRVNDPIAPRPYIPPAITPSSASHHLLECLQIAPPPQSWPPCVCLPPSPQILLRNRATELNSRMNDGTTPLILAARLAVEGMVEELVHCHADINAVDDHGQYRNQYHHHHHPRITGSPCHSYQTCHLDPYSHAHAPSRPFRQVGAALGRGGKQRGGHTCAVEERS